MTGENIYDHIEMNEQNRSGYNIDFSIRRFAYNERV